MIDAVAVLLAANAASLDELLADVAQSRKATVVTNPAQQLDLRWVGARAVVRTELVPLGEAIEVPADALDRMAAALLAEYEAEHGVITQAEMDAL